MNLFSKIKPSQIKAQSKPRPFYLNICALYLWPAWAIWITCLTLTLFSWQYTHTWIEKNAHQRFERWSIALSSALITRLNYHHDRLRTLAAHLSALPIPTQEQWQPYIESYEYKGIFPEIRDMGFISPDLNPENVLHLDNHLETKQLVANSAQLNEAGKNHQATLAVFQAPKNNVMTNNNDMVIYVPIYKNLENTIQDTKKPPALIGYVYADLRLNVLVEKLWEEASRFVGLKVFDSQGAQPFGLSYKNINTEKNQFRRAFFEEQREVRLLQRDLTLIFSSKPLFEESMNLNKANYILEAGLMISFLFTALTYSEILSKRRAQALESLNKNLETEIQERMRIESSLYKSKTQLEYQANHDSLTGLPNRTLLMDRLNQAIMLAQRHKRLLAVAFIDLDHFKFINDTMGHKWGDEVLQVIARRLKNCVREVDTVARLGGDEFVVLLSEQTGLDSITRLMKRMLTEIAKSFILDNQEISLSCSIGISVYPKDGENSTSLLKNADTAMYQSKEQGRNSFQLFKEEMNAKISERLHIENELRHALERNELFLVYQPQIDLHDNKIIGIEALLRWQHPKEGLIMPPRFIPVAEDSGLIIAIGEWVIRKACIDAKNWSIERGYAIPVSVNLSPRQFKQKDLAERIAEILKETDFDAKNLELEITESILMGNPHEAIDLLNQLKKLGVKISLDDFGTGYSSLNYLQHVPVDRIKIDHSFMKDLSNNKSNAAIVQAMITLGHSLHLSVIAEGVETQELQQYLREHECDQMQGYFAIHPLLSQQMSELLAKEAASYSLYKQHFILNN